MVLMSVEKYMPDFEHTINTPDHTDSLRMKSRNRTLYMKYELSNFLVIASTCFDADWKMGLPTVPMLPH